MRLAALMLPLPTLLLSLCLGCGGSGGTPAADGGDAPVTYQDVKPIFMKKCVPCHLPGGIGAPFHTLAYSYETAKQPSSPGECPGKTKGECTLVFVKSGFMPFEKGCSGDPTKDAGNAACLTAAEQLLLADWIADGLLEK
jgi:hypothetical protein